MKIVVTATAGDLDAPASPVFGRCPVYVFIDPETMAFEAVENPAIGAAGGAGIQAAQFVVERGAQAIVTGNVGPNAFNVLQSAGVPIYVFDGGTVRQTAEAYKAGRLAAVGTASAPAHAGMGMGRGMGRGGGMGKGRGMGRGVVSPTTQSPPPAGPSREEEITDLQNMAGNLRKQLAEVMDRLDKLEKGG
jgi:predicted Fe-Mo cluster-binding NifX family protein